MFRKTARNFNPLGAMAGKVTIAEAEEIVDTGELDPDQIHTPGIFMRTSARRDHENGLNAAPSGKHDKGG